MQRPMLPTLVILCLTPVTCGKVMTKGCSLVLGRGAGPAALAKLSRSAGRALTRAAALTFSRSAAPKLSRSAAATLCRPAGPGAGPLSVAHLSGAAVGDDLLRAGSAAAGDDLLRAGSAAAGDDLLAAGRRAARPDLLRSSAARPLAEQVGEEAAARGLEAGAEEVLDLEEP